MVSPKSARKPVTGRLITSVLVLILAASVFLYRQQIVDQLSLQTYEPSAAVSAITERVSLTDKGKYYFYISQPQVQDRTTFNQSCTTMKHETTVVLGCYATQRIYLFDVTDAKLDGIKEVTAAHEMLHAVYDRLPATERVRVDKLIETEAAKITDPDFVKLMKAYEQTEPGAQSNELHSIVGTQVGSLSPELEAYYGQYFQDRAKIVGLYSGYEAVFASVQDEQEQLVQEMDSLVSQIDQATDEYNDGVSILDAAIKQFNSRAQTGEFSSQSQFDAERLALVARQRTLAENRALIDGYIATYNTKKQLLATINSQAEALNQSINSSLTPVPSI